MSEKKKHRGRSKKVRQPYPTPFLDLRRPYKDPQLAVDFWNAVQDGKHPNPNSMLMTAKQYGDVIRAQNSAIDAGQEPEPSVCVYSMIRREFGNIYDVHHLLSGKKGTRRPSDVPEDAVESEKGDIWQKELRRCHGPIRDMVTEPDTNVLKIRDTEYIVGTTDTPAIFLVNPCKTGVNKAAAEAGIRLSFEGNPAINSMVGQINKSAMLATLEDGTVVDVLPGHWCKWGHLYRDDRKLSNAQIRSAVEKNDFTGISFKEHDVLIGTSHTKSKLWTPVKKLMSHSSTVIEVDGKEMTALERFEGKDSTDSPPDERMFSGQRTLSRTAPHEMMPFGFKCLQLGVIPNFHYGKTESELLIRYIIGGRVSSHYKESKWEARYRLNPDDYEDVPVEKAVNVTIPKKKTETKKPKSEKKSAKTKSTSKKKTKSKSNLKTKSKSKSKPKVEPKVETEVDVSEETPEEIAV